MHDAEAKLAVTPSHVLGDLACIFPFMGLWRDICVDIVSDVGTETMVEISVVRVCEVKLGEERFAVGGCWKFGFARHCVERLQEQG